MARPPAKIVDTTPLDGSEIDLSARIGWLLRMWRLHRGVGLGELHGRLVAQGLDVSVSSLSVAERTGLRDGQVLDGYETALDLPRGQVRAPVDLVARMVADAPPDRRPGLGESVDLESFDALLDRLHGESPIGSDWLLLGRLVGPRDGSWALPSRVIRPLLDRLFTEMVRSVGLAYVSRYRAIGHLQEGHYADLVEEAARGVVAEDGGESVMINAISPATDRPSRRLLEWAAGMLDGPSTWSISTASYSIQSMRERGGLAAEDWAVVVPHFLRAHAAARDDHARGQALTMLFKTLPAAVRTEITTALSGPLAPVATPMTWTSDRRNAHFVLCEELSGTLGADTVLGEQPMLARLLFELVFDFRVTRRSMAAKVLMCSPLVDEVELALLRLAAEGEDEMTRRGALNGLPFMQAGRVREPTRAWFVAHGAYDDHLALSVAGNAGIRLPDDALEHVTGADDTSLRVVEALGMAADPRLHEVSQSATDPALRGVAGWWLRHGGRVVE